MGKIIKILKGTALLLLFTAFVYSCETNNEDGLVTDVSVNINSFSVNGVEGNIDHKSDKISVILPYGTNITALIPQISIPLGATVTPGSGSIINFAQPVKFRVKNGNIQKDYEINVKAQDPIISFKINGLDATINHSAKTINLTVPEGTVITALHPIIELAPGVNITPASGATLDFTNPVQFTVTNTNFTEVYTAKVSTPINGPSIAFIGTAPNRNALTNPDEIAASDWLFSKYSGAIYVSFNDISAGALLNNIDVLWWHYDSATGLPNDALNANTTGKIKTYLNNGGNILLTSFASQYVDALGIVPSGKGPNNVFGDFLPNGFVDGNDWGMSFVGHENHPVFEGLLTYEPGKANLLKKNTFRLNHTAWWFLPDWGGYDNGAGWRTQTGGNNLASEAWDNSLDGRVSIAEFPGGAANKKCIVISMGAYDWYNETSNGNPSQPNDFIENIKTLTFNSLNYLKTH
ncbi:MULTISPECIES: DUF4960 domain-containing protein [Chryseobacterium]|uniref:DUF4960 domain-containing protein n=1 Tax=Chryseobacterium TaxID=59732 RepID=UPI00195D65CE|nr:MULTISPECIES: DUF4960 domain-containing protein [Chryseobacterium]MBM7420254.1 hypothetical protein [Chryseobacterium sp. JUb44]MDH6210198.1 hypothetical protein [Chryseobacterium sp. BIGb0186]WSO08915.1 DUF4960 domain-containing protein [Chryseobacterium scophthalmum]